MTIIINSHRLGIVRKQTKLPILPGASLAWVIGGVSHWLTRNCFDASLKIAGRDRVGRSGSGVAVTGIGAGVIVKASS